MSRPRNDVFRRCCPILALLVIAGSAPWAATAAPAASDGRSAVIDPLTLVPPHADFFIHAPKPWALVDEYAAVDAVRQFKSFHKVQDLLDSTGSRRFGQLVGYVEKRLGLPWPELLNRLTGGGAVLSARFGENAPALLVIQGTDEAVLKQFVAVAGELIEQEFLRQDGTARLTRARHRETDVLQAGKDFRAAVVGTTLLISNREEVLRQAIDRRLDGGPSLGGQDGPDSPRAARAGLPGEPLVWSWISLRAAHASKEAKDTFATPRNNFLATFFIGGWLDVAGRAPYLTVSLHRDGSGFRTLVRMPRGRADMAPGLTLHVPPEGKTGTLPLLEPEGVLYSKSYHFDLAELWARRANLFPAKQVQEFEAFDKRVAPFLFGTAPSKIYGYAGPHQRFVVAVQKTPGYRTTPAQRYPAAALVVSLRDPERFSATMEPLLRTAALLPVLGDQIKLHLVEEEYHGVTLIGYRFDEDAPLPADPQNTRLNASPCFVTVGDQFIASSTIELARSLVDEVLAQQKSPGVGTSSSAERSRLYGSGAAAALEQIRDRLLAETFLDQALSPAETRGEVGRFLDWVRSLGAVETDSGYGSRDFWYSVRLTLAK